MTEPVPVTPSSKEPLNPLHRESEVIEKHTAATGKYDDVDGLTLHRKRFFCWSLTKKQWIFALVGLIVGVLAVVLLILFLAIIPSIFQGQVDKVVLTVNHMDLVTLSPDASVTDITVELSVRVSHDSMAAATMAEAVAELSYNGQVFGEVTLPETKLEKGKHEFDLVVKGTSKIVNMDAFHEVSKAVVTEETFEITANAQVKISAMGLSYSGLDLERTLTVTGLKQFSKPASEITHIEVRECNSNEYKMLTNITLENDSSIGLDGIGVLNMSVYFEQQYLGQAVSIDAPLGIPRGKVPKSFMLSIQKEEGPEAALGGLLRSLLVSRTQFFITGNNPYAVTEAVLLSDALAKLNMSVLYTHGLDPDYLTLDFPPECLDLLALLG